MYCNVSELVSCRSVPSRVIGTAKKKFVSKSSSLCSRCVYSVPNVFPPTVNQCDVMLSLRGGAQRPVENFLSFARVTPWKGVGRLKSAQTCREKSTGPRGPIKQESC